MPARWTAATAAQRQQVCHDKSNRYSATNVSLSTEELAFYDALAQNQSAVAVMGDESLAFLARELLQTVRRNATIDWSVQESARAKMRIAVKRLLRQTGYPPDLQEAATRTVVQQAEWLAGDG